MTLSVLPLYSWLLYTFNHYQLSFLSAPLLGTLKYAYEMFMWKEEKTKHNAQFWAVDDPLSFTSAFLFAHHHWCAHVRAHASQFWALVYSLAQNWE